MEAVIPLFALGSLYVVNKNTKKKEGFNDTRLPNVNTPNKNYPQEYPVLNHEEDQTTQLAATNKYNGSAYTDKFFDVTGLSSASPTGGEYYSLTGEKVSGDYFEHNNMVPYFGSKSHTMVLDENTSESILDNYTGAGSQDVTKKEQMPLFAPNENYQWSHGAPNENDFYQSRVNASMKMSNVLPFEQEQVAPGLGLGYNTQGSDGFNAGMMSRDEWKPKTVDELRTANKPRAGGISVLGREGPAVSHIKKIGMEGKFEKNRPDRHYENGMDRWFTTGGLEKGETARSIQIDRFTNRKEVGREYAGIAGHYNNGEYVSGKYQKSRNIELGAKPIGIAGASNKANPTTGDYGIQGKKAYPNNRSTNNETNYFGAIGYSVNAAVAPLMDMLRPTRKEDTAENMSPYRNAHTAIPESYVYDPSQKAPTTHRETLENKVHLNINRQQNGDAYMVTEHQPVNNARTKTGDFYYSGVAGAGDRTQEMRSYEAEYNQRNNDIKSSTIKGRMVPGNMKLANHSINMKQAQRDTHLKNSRALTATMPTQAPSMSSMGVSSHHNNKLFSGINSERNDNSIASALQGNPYVVDYKNML